MTRERLRRLCDQGIHLSLIAMLLVIPLVFYTFAYDVFEYNKITAFRLLSLLALLAYLTKQLLLSREPVKASPLWPPVIAIGITSLLSTIWTNNFATSIFGVYEDFEGILTIANYILLFFLVNQHLRHFNDARKFLTAVVVAGTLAGGYGVAQNFGFDFIMWNPTTYSAARMFGTLGNPNFLAAFVLMCLPVAGMLFLMARRPALKTLLLLMFLEMAVSIIFTKSRGAMYALAGQLVVLVAYFIYDWRHNDNQLWKGNRRWLVALALAAGLTLLLPNVRSSIVVSVERTVATLNVKEIHITPRLYIWRSALQMIRDHPLLGTGLDTFQITFPKYRLAEYWRLEWNGTPEKAHNFFLQIGATTGLLGLAAWLWLIGLYFFKLIRQLPGLSPPRRHLAAAIGLAQVGFLVQNQANFTVLSYGLLFWFFFGMGLSLDREEAPAEMAVKKSEVFNLAKVPLPEWLLYLAAAGLIFLGLVFSFRLWTADLYFKRGIIMLTSGYPEQAAADLAQSVALHPYREIYWVKYGIAYEEAAKRAGAQKELILQKAVEIHKHTIKMNPLNGYNFNNLGRVYKYWGDYLNPAKLKDAENVCAQASRLDPFNVYFALDLTAVYLSEQRYAEAWAIAEKLVKEFPDFALPYSYLGYIRLLQGDTNGAYQYLNTAAQKNWRGDLNTQSSTLSNLGIVQARRGELEQSAASFTRALDLRPQYLEARLNLAVVLERLGKTGEAVSEYRRILSEAPQYPQAETLRKKIAYLERGNAK
ncbi:MAG: tetratricopeptide repeat protein [Candidatus Firestonebacteria bacterium]|nr:tetratricopeptide repeat protein [Candidatus Firestonebacteria bacterium]